MTNLQRRSTPYEKPDELDRYDGKSEEQLYELHVQDPLWFMADHVPSRDRRAGHLVVVMDSVAAHRCLASVVEGPPRNPGPDECHGLLEPFLEAMAGSGFGVGLILHRDGPGGANDVDRRWHAALLAGAARHEVAVLGTVVRTPSGDLTRVGAPAQRAG